MNLIPNRFFALLLCSSSLFLSSSCSKDADLLSDYVISDKNDLQSIALLADDIYFINNSQSSMLLDVLNNDSFSSNSQVTIIATSEPSNGGVIINNDNTLTYRPNTVTSPEETKPQVIETPEEDSFEYTTEVITEQGETFRDAATVTISPADMGELKAFPGAEGFGKYTTGGRGGAVVHVTNLNDSGPGSLREALARKGLRTIVFDVGGDINLLSRITIGGTDFAQNKSLEGITIAGETAPFPGITIRNFQIYFHTGNVIMRYLTFRSNPNKSDENAVNTRNWGIGGYILENMIFDHLTLSHGGNENIGWYADNANAPIRNITLQNSMISKNNGDGNVLISQGVYNFSLLQNYLSHEQYRNPIIGWIPNGQYGIEVINNIIYGGTGGPDLDRGNTADFISNIFKSTPNMPLEYYAFGMTDIGYKNPLGLGSIYASGNFPSGTLGTNPGASYYSPELLTYNSASRVVPNPATTSWISAKSDIENFVLPNVGNSLYRDALDTQLINDYYNGTGDYSIPIISPKTSSSRPGDYDTDNDGMADTWELAVFGDLSKSANGDEDGDGYTNLETFLFSLVK